MCVARDKIKKCECVYSTILSNGDNEGYDFKACGFRNSETQYRRSCLFKDYLGKLPRSVEKAQESWLHRILIGEFWSVPKSRGVSDTGENTNRVSASARVKSRRATTATSSRRDHLRNLRNQMKTRIC